MILQSTTVLTDGVPIESSFAAGKRMCETVKVCNLLFHV